MTCNNTGTANWKQQIFNAFYLQANSLLNDVSSGSAALMGPYSIWRAAGSHWAAQSV